MISFPKLSLLRLHAPMVSQCHFSLSYKLEPFCSTVFNYTSPLPTRFNPSSDSGDYSFVFRLHNTSVHSTPYVKFLRLPNLPLTFILFRSIVAIFGAFPNESTSNTSTLLLSSLFRNFQLLRYPFLLNPLTCFFFCQSYFDHLLLYRLPSFLVSFQPPTCEYPVKNTSWSSHQ